MLDSGEFTILDLNAELLRIYKQTITAKHRKEIENFQKIKDTYSHQNRVFGQKRWRAKKRLLESGGELSKKQYKAQLDNIERSFPKQDVSFYTNEINRLSGRDFEFHVNDGYKMNQKSYPIKASHLLRKQSPAEFILKRLKLKIQKAINETDDEKKKDSLQRYLDMVLENIEKVSSKKKYTSEEEKLFRDKHDKTKKKSERGAGTPVIMLVEIIGSTILIL